MICMAAAGRKKGLSERIGKIFAEIINNKYIHRQLLDRVSRGG